jgi:hypothetical protein
MHVTGAGVFALVACGGSSEGDYGCQAGGMVTGPVAVPARGACSVPQCWRLVVRDSCRNTSEPCVSREEYDRTPLVAFWHGRTDR